MLCELRPSRVNAFVILSVGPDDHMNGRELVIQDTPGNRIVQCSAQMLAKCHVNPNPGDYYLVEDSGVSTLCSKAVFENRWREVKE